MTRIKDQVSVWRDGKLRRDFADRYPDVAMALINLSIENGEVIEMTEGADLAASSSKYVVGDTVQVDQGNGKSYLALVVRVDPVSDDVIVERLTEGENGELILPEPPEEQKIPVSRLRRVEDKETQNQKIRGYAAPRSNLTERGNMTVELAEANELRPGVIVKWKRNDSGHHAGQEGYGEVMEVSTSTSTLTVVVLTKTDSGKLVIEGGERNLKTFAFQDVTVVDEQTMNDAAKQAEPEETKPLKAVNTPVSNMSADLTEADLTEAEELPEGEDTKAELLRQNHAEHFGAASPAQHDDESIVKRFFRTVRGGN